MTETSDRTLLKCFAGCSTESIINQLGIEWKHLFQDHRPTGHHSVDGVGIAGRPAPKIKAVYRYTDETGALLYENVRFDPKDFRQRHFDQKGAPVWNLQGVRRVPYRLPQLCTRGERDVWLCEGEKDADSVAELGFTASSFKNWKPEFNRYIEGANVVIVRDHDRPGGVQAEEAARAIAAAAGSVRILDVWMDLDIPEKHGRDVSDYIFDCVKEEDMTKEEIAERIARMVDGIEQWRDPSSAAAKDYFLVKDADEWLRESRERPAPRMLFGEFWFEGEVCILFADTNVGKSILAVQIADSVAKGRSFTIVGGSGLVVECDAQKVLFFDFELTSKQFESRFAERAPDSRHYTNHYEFGPNFIRAEINPDSADLAGFESFEDFFNKSLEAAIVRSGAKVVIIDNITYLRDETENARNALPLMKYLKELKAKYGLSILALAHTPKRDSSKPLGRNDLQGSKMLINFCDSSFAIGESQKGDSLRYLKQIKARNTEIVYHGDNVLLGRVAKNGNFLGFTFTGTDCERDHLKAESDSDRRALIKQVRDLSLEGKKQREIAEILQLSTGSVNKYLKQSLDPVHDVHGVHSVHGGERVNT